MNCHIFELIPQGDIVWKIRYCDGNQEPWMQVQEHLMCFINSMCFTPTYTHTLFQSPGAKYAQTIFPAEPGKEVKITVSTTL